jgi:hypothetical protein
MTKTALLLFTAQLTTSLFAQDSTNAGEVVRKSFTLSAGTSLPLGDFGDGLRHPAAQLGAALSADFAIGGSTAWISSILVSYNTSDHNIVMVDSPGGETLTIDPWWTIWPMTGIEWCADPSPSVVLAFSGQVGCFIGISPWFILHYPPNGDASISSDRALAVSIGAAAGATFSNHYAVKVRYLYAKPSYDLTFTDLGVTSTTRESRPTSLLALTLGWTW